MEYWEFLLQKEGDRSWQPVKPPRLEIEAGRYRVVSHSSRTNTDVEICVTHTSTDEVPPKRRSQKRSRRTNPEGLMVVIPFTYLKPGLWELRCYGDIMSDFLGKSWQHSVQLQVVTEATEALPVGEDLSPIVDVTPTETEANLSEISLSTSSPDILVEATSIEPEVVPLTPLAETEVVFTDGDSKEEKESDSLIAPQGNSSEVTPFVPPDGVASEIQSHEEESETVESETIQTDGKTDQQPELSTTPTPLYAPAQSYNLQSWETQAFRDVSNPDLDEAEPLPATLVDLAIALEPTESDENQNAIAWSAPPEAIAGNLSEVATPTNPILDESLQMLEQVLQQVLDPVLQEFEWSEDSDLQLLETPELEQALEPEPEAQGFILTLNEESLLARRGESFTIAGQVDVSDIDQPASDRETTADASNYVFQGSLRYVLREPQTTQVLLDVQQPIAEQALPLSFSHALEIPSNCNTRLILGKVTLYGPTEVALASQPFSITVDLDELLGAIIPGSQVMPVAKVQVLADNPIYPIALPEPQQERPEVILPPLNQASLDLVNLSQSHQSLQLQPAPRQALPPQIYQPTTPSPKGLKSLQLPNFPRIEPVATTTASEVTPDTPDTVDNTAVVKPEDAIKQLPPADLTNGFSPEIPAHEPADTAEVSSPELPTQEVEELEEATAPNDTVTVDDALLSILDAIEEFDASMSVTNSNSSDAIAFDTPQSTLTSTTEQRPLVTSEPSKLTADSELDTSDTSQAETTAPTITDSQLSEAEVMAHSTAPESLAPQEAAEIEIPSAEAPGTEQTNDSTEVDSAFQSLNVQERFWTRLNALATDIQSPEWLWPDLSPSNEPEEVEDFAEEALNPDLLNDFDESIWAEESEEFGSAIAAFPSERNGNGTAQEVIEQSTPTDQQQPPTIEQSTAPEEETPEQPPLEDNSDTDWTAQEFVVEDQEFVVEEDEELAVPAPAPAPAPKQLEKAPQAQPIQRVEPIQSPRYQPEATILPSKEFDTPLPAPELLIPASELAAGETVTIRVQLPPHPTRLYVKLWVQDRQSRSLLDGPRWLVDFIPDRSGEQEALTQLVVPFGSAEIRFEAIAVDVDTQRESRKVSVDCVVVPPDLQDFSLDEF